MPYRTITHTANRQETKDYYLINSYEIETVKQDLIRTNHQKKAYKVRHIFHGKIDNRFINNKLDGLESNTNLFKFFLVILLFLPLAALIYLYMNRYNATDSLIYFIMIMIPSLILIIYVLYSFKLKKKLDYTVRLMQHFDKYWYTVLSNWEEKYTVEEYYSDPQPSTTEYETEKVYDRDGNLEQEIHRSREYGKTHGSSGSYHRSRRGGR